ncbi:MAG: hypothetical protein RL150_309 [Candidatus Parcubacteria bacterium]|jgi:alkaline phosphatase
MTTNKKEMYVDGFVLTIPKSKRAAYKKIAKEASQVWLKFGAIDYKECRADDMMLDQVTFNFPKMAKAKPDEEVWFSYITYASKADRKKVNKQVMAFFDEKYATKKMEMPFDMKRMAVGGFVIEVQG